MKILILQLARHGDILQSWPAIKALRRNQPGAEIHMLVRERFSEFGKCIDAIDQLYELPTREILKPIIESDQEHKALDAMVNFADKLVSEKYDRIINLSFSPFSSYLVDYIAEDSCKVSGYTRHADGFLDIPDDASAYFYAQVGIQRFNRFHLSDIFAAVVREDLLAEDWEIPEALLNQPLPEDLVGKGFVALHIGASEAHKRYSTHKWAAVVRGLVRQSECQVVLLGGPGEEGVAEDIKAQFPSSRVVDLVGKAELKDNFSIVNSAKILIGGDSVFLHIASLTKTPTLNLSFASVNFWETGPRAPGSYVLWARDEESLPSDRVVQAVVAMLAHQEPMEPFVAYRQSLGGAHYELHGFPQNEFSWKLIEAIYCGGEFPVVEDLNHLKALQKIFEASCLALQQLPCVLNIQNRKTASQLLDQAELTIDVIERMVPEISPLIQWFKAEKTRVPPGSLEDVTEATIKIYENLQKVCRLYVGEGLAREIHSLEV